MDDLVAFIRARLDEDEANARDTLALWLDTHFTIDPGSLVIVEFQRRHDPARVLREVAAKRAMLAAYDEAVNSAAADLGVADALESILRHIAAVYSDHPDYRQEWAPDRALPDHG